MVLRYLFRLNTFYKYYILFKKLKQRYMYWDICIAEIYVLANIQVLWALNEHKKATIDQQFKKMIIILSLVTFFYIFVIAQILILYCHKDVYVIYVLTNIYKLSALNEHNNSQNWSKIAEKSIILFSCSFRTKST